MDVQNRAGRRTRRELDVATDAVLQPFDGVPDRTMAIPFDSCVAVHP
jgi:hypothetical protein